MKKSSKIPDRIRNMVATARKRGLTSHEITDHINGSATARKLGVAYNSLQIAGVMAGLARVR